MPRFPFTTYSFLLRVAMVVLGIAGICAVMLCLMRVMTPYYEVLVSYWNLHVRRRLWAQDLQVVADMVGIPISIHSEQESRLVLSSWRYSGLGNSGCWETIGYLMKAGPCVWLDPKGGMNTRAVCPGFFMLSARLLWISGVEAGWRFRLLGCCVAATTTTTTI